MTGIRFARIASCLAVAFAVGMVSRPALAQLRTSVAPPPSYYGAVAQYNMGEYRDALGSFKSEWRGAIKNGPNRWIDSICFHAMAGECYYQMGAMGDALNEYNNALNLFAVHADWMLSVQFPNVVTPLAAGKTRACPWGQIKAGRSLRRLPRHGDDSSGPNRQQSGDSARRCRSAGGEFPAGL